MGKAPLKSKLKHPTLAQETWITLHATWFLSHGTQMEKFLSKEVLRYSLYKTLVWFITIVVKEGQKKMNVSYSKSTIISLPNHTDETINIKYSNVFEKVQNTCNESGR